jgi:hypothetical protein
MLNFIKLVKWLWSRVHFIIAEMFFTDIYIILKLNRILYI